MATEFISPNLHVVLIHYPLGLLVAGTFIELFSFIWPRSGIRIAARWMILLGAFAAIPTTFSGIYALVDIATRNNPATAASWVDLKAASPFLSQPLIWQMLKRHALYQSVATGLSVLAVVIWLGCSDRARQLVRTPLMLLLLASVAAMILGAWNGGESVYRHGVGMDMAPPVMDILTHPGNPQNSAAPGGGFSILEIHVIAAGFVIAIAMAAIGLSIRKITVKHEIIRDLSDLPAEQKTIAEGSLRTPASSMAMLRSFNPGIELTVAPFAPAARFWLLAGLLAIMTAAGGVLVLAQDSDASRIASKKREPIAKVLWEQIKPDAGQSINRPSGHLMAGSAIILITLILAGVIRYAPRQRFWMGMLSFVLLAAVASQIWLGILLLYDSPVGSISAFNPAEKSLPTTP